MWIRIMVRNDHQRASVSTPVNNFMYFFAFFISGVELPALWMNCHSGNIRFARITQLSTDFWYILYVPSCTFTAEHDLVPSQLRWGIRCSRWGSRRCWHRGSCRGRCWAVGRCTDPRTSSSAGQEMLKFKEKHKAFRVYSARAQEGPQEMERI